MAKKLLHRSEITRELVEKWVAECGTPSDAAKRHYSEIENGRYPGTPCTYNAARHFIADVLSGGPPSNKILINASEEHNLNRLRELLLAANVPVEQIGKIKVAGFTSLGVKLKQEDGSEKLTSKYNTRLVIEPSWADGPKWPVIQPAPAFTVSYSAPVTKPYGIADGPERIFFVPDAQIGWLRSTATGELVPMHDAAAIDVMLQMLAAFKPHRVVILGDLIDLAMLSRWTQLAEFQHTLQPALNYTCILLARIRAIVGLNCKIDYLAGNHERRLSEFIAKNAIAAHGIRAAEKNLDTVDPITFMPKTWDWPVLSIPKLLHLKELGIEYSAEYPGGEVWLNKRNVCTHPPEKVTKREIRANVYSGHIPYVEEYARTIHRHPDEGSVEYTRVSVPGLMRTDDVRDKSSLQRSSVASSMARMNWQQGVGTLLIFSEKLEKHEICRIKDGVGVMGDRVFTASVDVNGKPLRKPVAKKPVAKKRKR